MRPRLITRAEDGSLIVDSDYICMGLVKSGYLQGMGTVQRRRFAYANSDEIVPYNMFDPVHGFTVKAVAPLVFISGQSAALSPTRSGELITMRYGGASTGVRYWVFDLMADRGPGPKLRMRLADGTVTFDSDQIPLNVVGQVTPPLPSGNFAYAGGATSGMGIGNNATAYCRWSTAFQPGADLAVSLPWNRAGAHTYRESANGFFSSMEGAYGSGGSVAFMYMTEPGCLLDSFRQSTGTGAPPYWFGIPTDRRPTATVINATGLPFPYDITGA